MTMKVMSYNQIIIDAYRARRNLKDPLGPITAVAGLDSQILKPDQWKNYWCIILPLGDEEYFSVDGEELVLPMWLHPATEI